MKNRKAKMTLAAFAKQERASLLQENDFKSITGGGKDDSFWENIRKTAKTMANYIEQRWEEVNREEPTYRESVNAGSNGVER